MSRRKDSWITGRLERTEDGYRIVDADGTLTDLAARFEEALAEGIQTHVHLRTYYKHAPPADVNNPHFFAPTANSQRDEVAPNGAKRPQ